MFFALRRQRLPINCDCIYVLYLFDVICNSVGCLCRRPGVLVLINDCDWELCGQLDATLEEKDVIVFISTLHGG